MSGGGEGGVPGAVGAVGAVDAVCRSTRGAAVASSPDGFSAENRSRKRFARLKYGQLVHTALAAPSDVQYASKKNKK